LSERRCDLATILTTTPETTAKMASTMKKTSHIVNMVIGVPLHGGSGSFSWS
jgi:hypothetical protein